MSFYSESNFYPDTSIGYLVRVLQQLGQASLDTLFADEGITGVQWSALIGIHTGRGETCAALARDMAHDKGAMTRMIDVLEAKGFVARSRVSEDRRLVNLSLTDHGRATALRCREKVIAQWNVWLERWSPDEIEKLIDQLQRLRAIMETSPACAA